MKRFAKFIRWSGLTCCVMLLAVATLSGFYRFGYSFYRQSGDLYIGVNQGEFIWGISNHHVSGLLFTTPTGSVTHSTDRFVFDLQPFSLTWSWVRKNTFTYISSQHLVITRTDYIIPFWFPLLILGTVTAFLFWRSHRRFPPGHCRECGYDLTGNISGVCSECGAIIRSPETTTPQTDEAREKEMANREIIKMALFYALIIVPISIILQGLLKCVSKP